MFRRLAIALFGCCFCAAGALCAETAVQPQTSAGSYLALDPPSAKKIVKAVKESTGDLLTQTHRPVLLTSMDIRRYVRKLIEMELYDLPVLSHQELTEEITIRPLGRIQLD